jgi:hypothetical protein
MPSAPHGLQRAISRRPQGLGKSATAVCSTVMILSCRINHGFAIADARDTPRTQPIDPPEVNAPLTGNKQGHSRRTQGPARVIRGRHPPERRGTANFVGACPIDLTVPSAIEQSQARKLLKHRSARRLTGDTATSTSWLFTNMIGRLHGLPIAAPSVAEQEARTIPRSVQGRAMTLKGRLTPGRLRRTPEPWRRTPRGRGCVWCFFPRPPQTAPAVRAASD